MKKSDAYVCLVCGFRGLKEAPRGAEGGGSYEICPSCGFQFGVDDDDRGIDPARARAAWVKSGMKWWSRGQKAPVDWNPQAQLEALTASLGKRIR